MPSTPKGRTAPPMAVIGMAGRFPGAEDVDALWSMLSSGTEAVRRFSAAELRSAGVPEHLVEDPDYLPYAADLTGIEDFDAAFFGITPGEARLIDPQHRIFLESVWAALEDAGTPPTAYGGRVGVFGSASLSSYLLHHVLRSADFRDQAFTYPVLLGNDKDFLATRASYALNLHGPSVSVQSACSSSLVAVDQACAALRYGRCDVAVAGGVSVFTPQTVGYRYQAGGTYARDGHCRPFDAAASGMVRGSGCGVVVLKRLDDALADRDHVYALIAGTAVNNDGSAKAGYSAPSTVGQDEVIRSCLDASGVSPSTIGYVEAHGTGTYLGDPIEVAALHLAYERTGDPPGECALGSVKANIGHLDAAAGITGLIKTALVLHHQTIPPQANFAEPNPELRLPETPFTIQPHLTRATVSPIRAAAVTSLGIGGTNAHCVLTRAPDPPARGAAPADGGAYVLRLSAPDEERVREAARDLIAHLERDHGTTRLDDLAYTLTHGRLPLAHRATVRAATVEEAVRGLREVYEGRFGPPGDRDGGIGDVGEARKIRLPGVRLRRVRHWIERDAGEPLEAKQPAGADREQSAAATTRSAVETAAEVFRTRLGVDSVGADDDYFALGGDSLHAIDVVDELCERLDGQLTLEQFTSLRTPRRVAQWYGAPHDDDTSMVLIKEGRPTDPTDPSGPADGTHRPVFLIHPSGGTVFFAHALAAHSTDPSPVYGIGYPVALADSLTTIPAMARHYVRLIRRAAPHGPYRIGGYSLGGTIALEAAQLLTGMGERVEQVLLWDTMP
ncbi:MAG: beta-ketoacyl synthase N-terminal-like domain-containing protein, partial [Streptomyces sp.]|uniref:beta-ketoacyl synthase N-terminal-like domain-containing protein n=1 Tax=Streptomyces sp. TaxID=1931 RepID=UPI003D6BBE05